MDEKEKIQELANKLKTLLEDTSTGLFFIMSENDLERFYKLNEFSKEREIEFKRKHLIDIRYGTYFIGGYISIIPLEFMIFSE